MKIDEIIFKEVLNTEPNFSNSKDVYTMMAIHYLLNANFLCDDSRMFEFDMSPEGLVSKDAVQAIKSHDIKSTRDLNVKFSRRANLFFESLKTAINKTSREQEIGQRSLLIATAGLLFIKNNVMNDSITDAQIKKCFDKKFKYFRGMYEVCEKTLRRIEYNKKELKPKYFPKKETDRDKK